MGARGVGVVTAQEGEWMTLRKDMWLPRRRWEGWGGWERGGWGGSTGQQQQREVGFVFCSPVNVTFFFLVGTEDEGSPLLPLTLFVCVCVCLCVCVFVCVCVCVCRYVQN
jgi:hypothetical protein